MFDDTPLALEEVIDQCCALAYAIIELSHPEAKEILMFILWERLDSLRHVAAESDSEAVEPAPR